MQPETVEIDLLLAEYKAAVLLVGMKAQAGERLDWSAVDSIRLEILAAVDRLATATTAH